MLVGQRSLFGGGAPAIDPSFAGVRRVQLDETAWLDHLPGWVTGHEVVFEALAATTRWHESERKMYDRVVDVPRLVAVLPADGPGHPLLAEIQRALQDRYGQVFDRVSMGYYRNGNDSVAWHGDYVAREMAESVMATVSLGDPRKFLLRPTGGGPSLSMSLGWGDLIVMGGSIQRTWQHAVPKVARAHPRISVMFRPRWEGPKGAYRPPGY